MEWLKGIAPNLVDYWDFFTQSIVETVEMVFISLAFVIVFGILLGIVLAVVQDGGLYENKTLNWIIPKIVNVIRSIPFIIFLAMIIPLTRLIVGTAIGVPGAIVPMVLAIVPFVGRQIELALLEVDPGVIEMGRSMGFSKAYIIVRIMLREAQGGIIRSIVLSAISLTSFSAMAGVVGGGGLGDFAIRYGYSQMLTDITWACVIVLLVFVFMIQWVGNLLLKHLTH